MACNQRPHQGTKGRLLGCERFLTTVPYDGYEWRNYGTKEIAGSLFKRCYYRCTYSPCPARKTVQQCNKDDPPMYMVTYLKEHTCNVAPPPALQSLLLSFRSIPASAGSPNCNQMDKMTHFQPQPSINKAISSSSLLQQPAASMQVETHAFEASAQEDSDAAAASWMNLPTSDELQDCLSSMMSFTAQVSHEGEARALDQAGNVGNSSLLGLPAPSGVMVIGSVEIETYAFEDVFDELEQFEFEL